MAIDINIPSQVRTFANLAAFPATGALKTIYIAEDTNKTYRWTGSVYVEISASAASGVTSVTATAPIASTGGATPDISIATSNTSTTGALSSTDWNTFNNKRGGVHYPLPLAVGEWASASLGGTSVISAHNMPINLINAVPFISSFQLVSSSLNINVVNVAPLGNARILIYSDLNGKPDQKLYESANLDCSTLGVKTALVSFTFTAGVTYYLCTHFSASTGSTTGINATGTMNIGITSTYTAANHYRIVVPFGSAPNPVTSTALGIGNVPLVTITVA